MERKIMKSKTFLTLTAMIVVVALAMPIRGAAQGQERQLNYSIYSLSTLGGTESSAYGTNDVGWVTGAANLPGDLNEHAVLW
jgi:hypothetical protein